MNAKVDYISNSITTNNQKEIKDILGKSNTNFNELKEEIKKNLDFSQIFKIIYDKLGTDRKTKSAEDVNRVPGMAFIIQAMIDLLDDYSGHQKVYNNMTLGEMLQAGGGVDNINGKKTKEIIRILQNCFDLPETGLVDGNFINTILSLKINTDRSPDSSFPNFIKHNGNLIPAYRKRPTQYKEIAEIPGSYTDGEKPIEYKTPHQETAFEVIGLDPQRETFKLGEHTTANGINTYKYFVNKIQEKGNYPCIASANIHIGIGTDAVPCRPGITKHNQKNYEKKRDSIISLLGTSQIFNKKDIITFLTDPSPERLSTTDKNGNTFANNWLAGERFLEAVGDAIRAFQNQKGMKLNFIFENKRSEAGQTQDKRDERYVETWIDALVAKNQAAEGRRDGFLPYMEKDAIGIDVPDSFNYEIRYPKEAICKTDIKPDTTNFPKIIFNDNAGNKLGEITVDPQTGYLTQILNGTKRITVSYQPLPAPKTHNILIDFL